MSASVLTMQEPRSAAPVPSSAPGARLALALLLAINLFNYIDRQVLAAVESTIEKDFFPQGSAAAEGVNTEFWMGLLATAFMVSYMVFAPVFGWLADRTSRWLLVGLGVLVWSLASGASGLAASFTVLLLTRCCVGIGEAAYGPAAPTILSDLYPVRSRGMILALFNMAIPVGSALGYVLGGQVATWTGDWRWAFYLVVPPGLLLGLLCFLMREPRRGQADIHDGSHAPHAHWRDYLVLLRTPSFVLCTLGMALVTFAIGAIGYWMPRYTAVVRQAGPLAEVNLYFGAIVVLSGLFATILGGILGDRLRSRFSGSYFLVSGISVLIGFPFVLLVLVTPFPAAWVLIFIAVFCLFFNTGPANTILANVTHPSIRATGFAVNIFVIHTLGDAISPPLMGFVGHHYGWNVAFTLISTVMLGGGLLWLWGSAYLQHDTERVASRIGAAD